MTSTQRAALAQYKLAKLWQRRGETERALEGYARAIALDSRCVPAHLERGDVLLRRGERAAAIEAYQRGLEANPQDASLSTHLAHALTVETNFYGEQTFVARASADGQNAILLISDFDGIYGVGQFNQLLLEGLERTEYSYVDTPQSLAASDSLQGILERTNPELVIFSDGNPLSNLSAKQIVSALAIPFVIIVHQTTVQHARAAEIARASEFYRAARAVLAPSCANLETLRYEFGLPAIQGRVIYHACPALFFAPCDETVRAHIRAELNIPADAVLVFTAARMELEKGYQTQLGALKRLRSTEAWNRLYVAWAGSGTAESQLRAEVMEYDMADHVRFLGERMDIPALLDASDIFVLTSEQEGIPRALMEAMAKGLPVAATCVDGGPEALGSTGKLLANPREQPQVVIAELAETLREWIGDAALRAAIGRDCHKRALELFEPTRMQREYIAALYDARA